MADVIIVTFREIFQHEAGKKGRYSPEYQKLSAQIILDKQDMETLGVRDGQNVAVENEVGQVVVTVKLSEDEPHPGLAFMINSPWSNQLVRDNPGKGCIPEFKNIRAKVSVSGEMVTQISELMKRILA